MTIGEMLRSFLTKLEWFSTLFPRIPVPVQKTIDQQIKSRPRKIKKDGKEGMEEIDRHTERRRSRLYIRHFVNKGRKFIIEGLPMKN